MFERLAAARLHSYLAQFPAVGVVGPRQVGKSTLAKEIVRRTSEAIYLDLERPSDRAKLGDPEAFFSVNRGRLVCLDEIQRMPELFAVLRSILDEEPNRSGQVLLLGSSAPELMRGSSESLAGRIAYLDLSPLTLLEIASGAPVAPDLERRAWLRGGYPRSFLASSDAASLTWREQFVLAFLERDIPQFGITIAAETLRRFWLMCAHLHGQQLNQSKLGASLGVTHTTARSYLELMSGAFVLRILPPCETNLKKRLVKAPKIYVRDSGLLHALLGIGTTNDLLGHPAYGASWEGFVIDNILAVAPGYRASYYKTAAGAELDLVLERGSQRLGIEMKASTAPQVTKGFWNAKQDLELARAYLVAPVAEGYPLGEGVEVITLASLLKKLRDETVATI